jgi:plasmid stabilization system protein ParE
VSGGVARRLVIHDAARQDVDEIAAGMSLGPGLRFYDAVQRTCEFLAEHPHVGTRRSARDPSLADLRSSGVSGFRNYLIFFVALADGVYVARVRHGARDNDAWLAGEGE